MDKGELKTAFLADSHRPGLSAHADRFVRLAEGLIARRMLGWELDSTITLDDTDRAAVDVDLYTLPVGVLQVRRVVLVSSDYPLTPVSSNYIAMLHRSRNDPLYYCVLGNRLQVRGVPGADAELAIDYRGRLEALSLDADTNAVLTAHEALYMHGCLHYLRRHTEDFELADAELAAFNDVCDQLNEEAGRKLGNAGPAPAYNFGSGGGY